MLHLPPLKIFMPGAGGYIIEGSSLLDTNGYLTFNQIAPTTAGDYTLSIVFKMADDADAAFDDQNLVLGEA